MAPTRELAQQIFTVAKKFAKVYNINCTCAFGGGSLYEQTLACQEGVELLVCTPVSQNIILVIILIQNSNFLMKLLGSFNWFDKEEGDEFKSSYLFSFRRSW